MFGYTVIIIILFLNKVINIKTKTIPNKYPIFIYDTNRLWVKLCHVVYTLKAISIFIVISVSFVYKNKTPFFYLRKFRNT